MLKTLTPPAVDVEPTWDIANLFPAQGQWDVEEYLALDSNHLIEFSNKNLEVLPMPTWSHQRLVIVLFQLLAQFVSRQHLGEVILAPLRIQLWPGKFREPDIVFMLIEHADRRGEDFWRGADLVMEIVSPTDRQRDLVTKRREYALAGIPEYWIVDGEQQSIIVLTLAGESYQVHGTFGPGQQAGSVLLPGFVVDVAEVFAAARA
ncbi:MAG: Uma2 family endonuclease [Caldilineales bacterium]|nr:Uma2 family endonuclease [Caldilineales bacterium]